MSRSKFLFLMSLLLTVAILAWSFGDALAQKKVTKDEVFKKLGKVTPSEQKAAAKRAAKAGLKPGVAGLGPQAGAAPLPGIEGPGGVPHYFGPYGNWAFSPLPKGSIGSITVDSPGTGYVQATTVVTIEDVYGTGSGATASATVVDGAITVINVTSSGSGYSAPIVTITDTSGGTNAAATPILTNLTGGMRKFVDQMPGLGPGAANALGQFIPVAVPQSVTYSGQAADYYEIALVEFSEKMHSDLPNPTRQRGYVQIVPAGWTGTDLLGNNYTAVPLTTANGLTQNITIGGVQAYGASKPHFLGPFIVAKGRVHGIPNTNPTDPGYPKPVRIKFYNLLPTGSGGDLFIPVDETVPGAGYGPALPGTAGSKYTQNRATIHLHGNNTVWISDGNVHQWITPPNESTPYPKGVSVRNVPDMGTACDAPGSGCMTFFYTNAQSARLQFYHDHAMGITRLNVYAGEAAGYVITDAVEQDLINGTNVSGVNIPGASGTFKKVLPGIGIPLVIQDRTFVDADTIFAQDPTWNWGTGPRGPDGKITAAVTGDLWYPHVYMSVQNPWDLTGTNAFGRWHYGPWFNPPTPTCDQNNPIPGCIEVGPVPNEYYQPVCDGLPDPVNVTCTRPWEPPFRPGVPNPSIPGESFLDTPIVNGTAYPYLEVEPKAYRFRILNAANDRFLNLQLYVAANKNFPTTAGTSGAVLCTGAVPVGDCTEVAMVPVSVAPANQYADTPSGIPDPTTAGPPWILIGTEGGFMPKPVVVPQQPIGYNLDPAYFAFGIVNQYSLFLGSAERADVVVDFSAFAGKTLCFFRDYARKKWPPGGSPITKAFLMVRSYPQGATSATRFCPSGRRHFGDAS